MPTSKEAIRRKYGLTDEEFDVVEALALRPNCEHCNKQLPPDSIEARICTFECTFCSTCVDEVIGNVCPNCGGGFAPRPIRPSTKLEEQQLSGRSAGSKTAKTQTGRCSLPRSVFGRNKEAAAAGSLMAADASQVTRVEERLNAVLHDQCPLSSF